MRLLSPAGKVVSAGATTILLLVAVTTALSSRRYRSEIADATRELRSLDLLLATDTGRSLQGVRLVLDGLAEQLEQSGLADPAELGAHAGTAEVYASLRARASGVPQLDALSIVDQTGKLVNFSRTWPVPAIRLDDRDYFRVLRDRSSEPLYLTEPVVNRGSHTRTVYLARRLQARDGSFRGMVLGAIELGYFERLYTSLSLERGNAIALLRQDGTILASFPPWLDAPAQGSAPALPADADRQEIALGGTAAWETEAGRHHQWLVSSAAIDGFPLRISVARRRSVIVRDWRREVLALGGFLLIAVLCIVAMSWAIIRRFRAYEAVNAAAQAREQAILARQKAEDALRQSQKMEAMGQLTGGVAHDFNNLLTVIGSSVELLRRENLNAERRARYVEAIADASGRAAKLTGQLLAFSRRQALKPEVFDAAANVGAVAQMIDRLTGARVEVATSLPGDACHVKADPNQFDTSLVNLAVNARDAMPDGGRLTISVARYAHLPATSSRAAGSYVSIRVSDTGVGIPAALHERVFEPFFTTKGVGQGTGLGLSQVIGFARQSGGDVTIESEAGQGAAFTLHLPLAEAAPTTSRPRSDFASVSNGRGSRILVVDDDPAVARLTSQLLRELKYFSVTADCAETALDLLEADPGGFDAIFSDVVMPGMDGIALARTIKARDPDLPVVLTTGFSATLADSGAEDLVLLHKPFGIEDLAHTLHDALAAARESGSSPGPPGAGRVSAPAQPAVRSSDVDPTMRGGLLEAVRVEWNPLGPIRPPTTGRT